MKTLQLIAQGLIIVVTLFDIVTSEATWHEASDGRKYLIETAQGYDWYRASHECARKDAQLITIDSETKNMALIQLLKKDIVSQHQYWIGGNDEYNKNIDQRRPFYWSSTGEQFKYTFWSPNEPNNENGDEHCALIWTTGTYEWDDGGCNTKIGYICEENHFIEKFANDLEEKRTAVNETITEISQSYAEKQKQQVVEINIKIQNIDDVINDWKSAVDYTQTKTLRAIQAILNDQQKSMEYINNVNLRDLDIKKSELRQSIEKTNIEWRDNLNGQLNAIKNILEN